MLNCNSNLTKLILYLLILLCVLVLFYYGFVTNDFINNSLVYTAHESSNTRSKKLKFNPSLNYFKTVQQNDTVKAFNIWCIFTKVSDNSPLKIKFRNLITSAIKFSSVPLKFNIISDVSSKDIAIKVLENVSPLYNYTVFSYEFYDIQLAVSKIQDIYKQMIPHFSSSRPGAYYSDALFYLSLGLYRIASDDQDQVVMLDCDVVFTKDVKLLFQQFNSFPPSALFGLVPELSPVYHHVLHSYRIKHNTTFGEFIHPQYKSLHANVHPFGYQGYNSGVVLFKLNKIRDSKLYPKLFTKDNVDNVTAKYYFRGHLGDQDFYTLLGYEYPELFYSMPCIFNRQLCTWWRDRGYANTFSRYFNCDGDVVIYHGNCNTRIP